MNRLRIKRIKPSLLGAVIGITFISFAMILFMVDLTSNIVGSGGHGHKKKSALSLFTEANSSGIRGLLGQLTFYQSNAYDIKSAFPTYTCGAPPIISNTSDARLKTDVSFITLDELSWETFGDYMPTVGKLSHLSNQMMREVNKTAVLAERNQTVDEVFHELGLLMGVDEYIYLPGGHWKPLRCAPKWKVAVIVPFRDRVVHLAIFLRHMIPLLKRQKLEFSIFVVEQDNKDRFNRAMLFNVGFLEALKLTRYDCFVFHDVDHLAVNVNNYYGCDNMPRHFISGDDIWGYTIAYEDLFGGVTGLTTSQMHHVNGFSNVYWGWGGEDDDMYKRVLKKGYPRSRPRGQVGYYNTIRHHDKHDKNAKRLCLLKFAVYRMDTDGLNSIRYKEPTVDLTPLFTKVSVDIAELPWKGSWTKCEPLMDLYQVDEDEASEANATVSNEVPHPLKTAIARRKQPFTKDSPIRKVRVKASDEQGLAWREAEKKRQQELEIERRINENAEQFTAQYNLQMDVL